VALFAEMVKGKSWTPATLRQVGGTEGMGARNKPNATYTARAAAGGLAAGLVFQNWWAARVGLAVLVGFHLQAGTARPGRRR